MQVKFRVVNNDDGWDWEVRVWERRTDDGGFVRNDGRAYFAGDDKQDAKDTMWHMKKEARENGEEVVS